MYLEPLQARDFIYRNGMRPQRLYHMGHFSHFFPAAPAFGVFSLDSRSLAGMRAHCAQTFLLK